MRLNRTFLLLLTAVISLAWFSSSGIWKKTKAIYIPQQEISRAINASTKEKLAEKAVAARSFAAKKGFNGNLCFLIDMSLPSGQNRFFIYDLKKDSLVQSGLVTHGNCNQYWLEGRKYNNVIGGDCTSLGRYKIGYSYNGQFGLAFKLHGLDSSNNKAFERFVVLHSHSCVPETEVADEICQSNGCPTVSPAFLQELRTIIQASRKPVLLWIYE